MYTYWYNPSKVITLYTYGTDSRCTVRRYKLYCVYLILRVYKKTELSMRGKQYFTVTRCTCTRTVRVHVLYVYSYKSRTKVRKYESTFVPSKVLSYNIRRYDTVLLVRP